MEYRHFSHPHYLKPYQLQNGGVQPNCSGCESSILSGSAYGCYSCNFFLHQQCAEAARSVDHPSHPLHHRTLLPYPTHPNGAYTCDACGLDGTAASYSCPLCDFDVHVPCALLPQTLENPSAHPHELRLSYALPHHGDKRHVCSICGEDLDYKLWTYDCFGCDFRTHCSCAVAAARKKAAATEEETECGGSGEESNVGGAAQQLLEIHNQAMKHQVEMYKLQVQMEATHQMCKLMSSFNF
ncbi:Protein kinase C-like, phorbol ester/diacylglycerol-binding domain containing protein [Trema orientale]|uniref:Protein kinase C-like, phorbol ester/diacylglycerol-binding domain containing protein n=1 Tax=Trema orientale TaxID=63057 RepID=A0A2P5APX1_TREOI|nr:Protein kinase C-like, phorbol ester/diacylglycerol-binding domain containing protein [Trema orientale]